MHVTLSSMAIELDIFRCLEPSKYLTTFLGKGIRPDGRAFNATRHITINVGSLTTANGSSLVRFGETMVVCGVKAEITKTSLIPPGGDLLICNVELPSCCRPEISSGPPSNRAQTLTQRMQSVFQKCVDKEQLLIENTEFCWVLYTDVICLCDDGNVEDACMLAATAALNDAKLSHVTVENELPKLSTEKGTFPINLLEKPISVTFALIEKKYSLLDPTHSEEQVCQGQVTFTVLTDGSFAQLFHTGEEISSQRMLQLGQLAQKQTQTFLKLLNTVQ